MRPDEPSPWTALLTTLALVVGLAGLLLQVLDDPGWVVRLLVLSVIPLGVAFVAVWFHGYRAGSARRNRQ